MGRTATLILVLTALGGLFAGCSSSEEKVSDEKAKSEILAPTDVEKLTPEQRAKVEGMMKGNAAAGGAPKAP